MADPTDDASDREQIELERAIAARRNQPARPVILPTNECRNLCGEPPAPGSVWCSSACCQDFAERRETERRQGVRRG